MGVLATILNYTGINLGYLYKLMGVLISSAVIPITLTLLWSKQNRLAATIAPIFGFVCSMTAWLTTTYGLYGEITVYTSNQNYPMLAGNLVALFSPLFVTLPLSFMWPENYTFEGTRQIEQIQEDQVISPPEEQQQKVKDEEAEQLQMKKSSKFAKIASVSLTLALFILWPLPMFGSQYVFSLSFFRGWVIVSIIWVFFSTFAVGLFPLWEARQDTVIVCKALWEDIRGRRSLGLPKTMAEAGVTESSNSVIVDEKKA